MDITFHDAEIKVIKTFLSNGNCVEIKVKDSNGICCITFYGTPEQAASIIAAFPKSSYFTDLDAARKERESAA